MRKNFLAETVLQNCSKEEAGMIRPLSRMDRRNTKFWSVDGVVKSKERIGENSFRVKEPFFGTRTTWNWKGTFSLCLEPFKNRSSGMCLCWCVFSKSQALNFSFFCSLFTNLFPFWFFERMLEPTSRLGIFTTKWEWELKARIGKRGNNRTWKIRGILYWNQKILFSIYVLSLICWLKSNFGSPLRAIPFWMCADIEMCDL